MKSEITFFGGIHTIGGVVMSIVYGKERVLLEIGTAYDPATDVNDGVVLKRHENWLKDDLYLNRVPKIDGIYSKKYLKDLDTIKAAEETDLHTAVFITHMHLDHMSCMGMLDDSVDVYLSKSAQKLEEALEDVGEGVFNVRKADYKEIFHKEVIRIGEIEIMPFLLNAKSYQDWSFYVKTPDLKLHYTGDLFLSGDYEKAVIEEMEYIKSEKVDVLVSEATTFMDSTMKMCYDDKNKEVIGDLNLPKGMLNKEMADEIMLNTLKDLKGLGVFNIYEREMSDVKTFNKMAKKCQRIIAYEPKTAYLIWKFDHEGVNIYIPDYSEFETNAKWFIDLCQANTIVDKKDVIKNPSKYLIQNTYPHILELFDLPSAQGAYLHSGGMPIGAYDPSYANLLKVLALSGFKHLNLFQKNFFSHAYPCQVKYYVDQINANVLVPTHSHNPERLFPPHGKQQLIPDLYKTYILENNRLVEKK